MNISSLITSTNAYKIFSGDKRCKTLSHATLIVCDDKDMLEAYVNYFAKSYMCESEFPCDNCRTCRLIESKNYEDVIFYPKDKKIKVEDIDDLTQKSYVKPLENDKKLFVLLDAQDMNDKAQNKLLKTLEEPPKNTYILLGATSTFSLLPTVLSRVKRLDILPFLDNDIYNLLKNNYDSDDLKSAIKLSDGRVGEVLKRLKGGSSFEFENLVLDIYKNLKSSKEIIYYTNKINKDNIKDFIAISSKIFLDVIRLKSGKELISFNRSDVMEISSEYTMGGAICAEDVLRNSEKSLFYNANVQATVDGILFGILEGRNKWSK